MSERAGRDITRKEALELAQGVMHDAERDRQIERLQDAEREACPECEDARAEIERLDLRNASVVDARDGYRKQTVEQAGEIERLKAMHDPRLYQCADGHPPVNYNRRDWSRCPACQLREG